jgi:hypothetical protein
MPCNHCINNLPRPWGTHYAAVTTSSTDKGREFVDGFAFMDGDGEEGLSWQHIEDVAAYDEDDLEKYTFKARIRERGYFEYMPGPAYAYEPEDFSRPDAPGFSWQGEKKDSGDGDAKERGLRGLFGPRVRKRSDMREFFRPVEERGSSSREGVSGSSLAQESASSSKKGIFGFGAKGKGPGKK